MRRQRIDGLPLSRESTRPVLNKEQGTLPFTLLYFYRLAVSESLLPKHAYPQKTAKLSTGQ